ncbi:MAG TPA: hypothetical protein VLU94_02070, partial [Candidatus Nitrosotalea sp.]|nr:hypothetical protein [Candidatus Nitrosotalea sp.]
MVEPPVSRFQKIQAVVATLFGDRGMAVEDESALHWFRKFIHFWSLVWRSFVRNRGLIRASALAYTTLLALIPLLAVGLGASTRLLKNSEQQTDELIQTVVDELAPQLGLSPATPEERSTLRQGVEEAFHNNLPELVTADPAKRIALANRLAEQLARGSVPADALPQEAARIQTRLSQSIQAVLPLLASGTGQQKTRRINKTV